MMRHEATRQRPRRARAVPVAAPPGLAAPLRTVRRRLLLRALLLGALWAALANLGVLAAFVALNRLFGLGLRTPFFAWLVLAVVAVRALRRVRLREAATALDASAGLRDRLVTAVELAAAPAADPEIRAAQLEETLQRLRGVDPARHPRLHPLLWGGPALFGGLLALAAYLSFAPQAPRRVPLELAPGIGTREPRPSPGGRPATEPLPGPPVAGPGPADGPVHGTQGKARPAGSPDQGTGPAPPAATRPTAGALPEGNPALPGAAGGDAGAQRGRVREAEPAKLFSEPVGTALTAVGDGAPGGGTANLPAVRGRVSFNLIPRQSLESAGGEGPGGAGGGTARALEVVVDFDALAPEHREHVRRYFEALQRP
jgi:hypothetical protein